LFVLTIDLDLRGDREIGVEAHRRLTRALDEWFDPVLPEKSIHPADVLTSITGPCPIDFARGGRRFVFNAKQVVKRLIGRPARPVVPFLLAVEARTFRRRFMKVTENAAPSS
jgi:hypothetical protein